MAKKDGIIKQRSSMPFSLLEIDTTGFHAVVIRMGTRRDNKGCDGRFTQAESAVARAAVAGLSNREIAEQRGSAPRTVAVQLRSIYRKLGISSRTELAAVIDAVHRGLRG